MGRFASLTIFLGRTFGLLFLGRGFLVLFGSGLLLTGRRLFGFLVLAFGQSLTITVQPHANGKREDFRACPPRVRDDDAQVDPVVSPVADLLGLRRTERIMVHAGSEDSQPSLATQRVIARENNDGVLADQRVDDQLGEQLPEMVDVPNGLREEAVVVGEVTVGSRVAGDDQVGDIAMACGKDPAGHQETEGLKARIGEDWRKRA